MKLADDLRLRRMTSVYEQQLELCERHQQEESFQHFSCGMQGIT